MEERIYKVTQSRGIGHSEELIFKESELTDNLIALFTGDFIHRNKEAMEDFKNLPNKAKLKVISYLTKK